MFSHLFGVRWLKSNNLNLTCWSFQRLIGRSRGSTGIPPWGDYQEQSKGQDLQTPKTTLVLQWIDPMFLVCCAEQARPVADILNGPAKHTVYIWWGWSENFTNLRRIICISNLFRRSVPDVNSVSSFANMRRITLGVSWRRFYVLSQRDPQEDNSKPSGVPCLITTFKHILQWDIQSGIGAWLEPECKA